MEVCTLIYFHLASTSATGNVVSSWFVRGNSKSYLNVSTRFTDSLAPLLLETTWDL